jgi:hypothetical protein
VIKNEKFGSGFLPEAFATGFPFPLFAEKTDRNLLVTSLCRYLKLVPSVSWIQDRA